MSQELMSHLMMASIDFERLKIFVEGLREKTDSDGALFRYLDYSDFSYPITVTCGSGVFSERFFAEYDGGWGLNDPQIRLGMQRKLPEKHIYQCTDHYAIEERKDDSYFRDFLPQHNIAWTSGYMETVDNEYGAGFAVVRSPDRKPYDEYDKELVLPIANIIGDSIRMLLFGQREKLVKHAIEYAHKQRLDLALCMDGQGRGLWATQDAQLAISNLDHIEIKDRRVVAREKTTESILSELKSLAKSLGPSLVAKRKRVEKRGDIKKYTLKNKDGTSLVINAMALTAESGLLSGTCLSACLIFTGGMKSSRVGGVAPIAGLEALTKQEMAIAAKIAEGMSAPEIANIMGVMPSTVRTHLKHIYRKLDVHSQPALAALYVRLNASD